jgi:hypothetical protein
MDSFKDLHQNDQQNKVTDLLQVTDSDDSDDNGMLRYYLFAFLYSL